MGNIRSLILDLKYEKSASNDLLLFSSEEFAPLFLGTGKGQRLVYLSPCQP